MQTTINSKLTVSEIERLFEMPNGVNIRLYEPINKKEKEKIAFFSDDDFNTEKINFKIVIRHNRNEKANLIFKKALSKIQ